MSLGKAFGEALRRGTGTPTASGDGVVVEAEAGGSRAEVDVVEADRIGVRVRGVRVTRPEPYDVAEEARGLPEKLRSLDEPVIPIEVDPRLGGAVLRTDPDEVREGEYYELGLDGRRFDLTRKRAEPGKDRENIDWSMTHRQLENLLDELD